MGFTIRTIKVFTFVCDHCKEKSVYDGLSKAADIRKRGWALSKDYKKCYCPKCAPKFRNVGLAYNGICSWR